MFVIAGLGNPDKKYEKTRHTVGFDVIDAMAKKYNVELTEKKHRALCGSGYIAGQKVLLVKPQTYMNLSGESIQAILNFYKLDAERDLLVIYDDISEKLKTQLGTKVNIVPKKDGSGKIEIEFYSHDELDRILDLMK